MYYGIVAKGNAGLEVFKMSKNKEDITKIVPSCKLRFRLNGHRNIKAYLFRASTMLNQKVAETDGFWKTVVETGEAI